MSEKKDIRARIEAGKQRAGRRILDREGVSIQDAVEGWWLRLIQGDEEAEAAAAEYHRAKADVEALERREERIEERISQLEEEREAVRAELEEARETVKAREDDVVAAAAGGDGDDEEEISDVAYDLLVRMAHDDLGTNRVSAGTPDVAEAARRLQVDPDELIEEMREMALGIEDELGGDRVVERSFWLGGQRENDAYSTKSFRAVRKAVAEEVLDDEDVREEDVPETETERLLG